MRILEAIRHRQLEIHRLAVIALLALTACSIPATPTKPAWTPIPSPIPSFMEGTKDLNCEESWDFITQTKENPFRWLFPGGKSQWWVGKYSKNFKNGDYFFFSSGFHEIKIPDKKDFEFAYRCSPYQDALELYNELIGK